MKLQLLPQPRQVVVSAGSFAFPPSATIGIGDATLYPEAQRLAALFGQATIAATAPGVADTISLTLDPTLPPDGYALLVTPQAISLIGHSAAGVFYGAQTLAQILKQSPGNRIPCLTVHDWPDFQDRGLYYDVCRGRVPKLEQLIALARVLAHHKINQLQLYIEHTFVFRGHPDIGRDASPLTATEILALDAVCRDLHIELVPSLASFGHLATVLKHPQYHALAEDKACGELVSPEAQELPSWARHRGWTLSPANPDIYPFLASLFAEFLPLFSSRRFNVCCDETWDLGLGQSYELCQRLGKGVVYLNHIKRLRDLAAVHGKQIMFWGDIIRHHPALIPDIPKDVIVLDWGYAWNHPFARVEDFKQAGLDFYVCPGTSSWVSLFPRLPEAEANIAGFAAAGAQSGARGLLNTDWGDGGHYNFMEYSLHGYLFGAEQSWNTGADRATFGERFCSLFLGTRAPAVAQAIRELGDVAFLNLHGYYQSVWQHALFAHRTSPIFTGPQPAGATFIQDGEVVNGKLAFDAALGRRTRKRLAAVRRVLARAAAAPHTDAFGILPYWLFAIDTMDCAARKLAAFGQGGRSTPAERAAIAAELRKLRQRFQRLWLARNRPSEIRVTLARYDLAIRGDWLNLALEATDAAGGVRLSVTNVGDHPVSGTIELQTLPRGRATIEGARALTVTGLRPGASQSHAVRVVLASDARSVLLEALPTVGCAGAASLRVERSA